VTSLFAGRELNVVWRFRSPHHFLPRVYRADF
jgi:hypothetical protein